MSERIKRVNFDFSITTRKGKPRIIEIVDAAKFTPRASTQLQRWYLSLHGENAPIIRKTSDCTGVEMEKNIYRYDWTFGITVITGHYWDWQAQLPEDSALAIHIILKPKSDEAAEAVPVSATLSALHPSRNTQSLWETTLGRLPKAAAEVAGSAASLHPVAGAISKGLTFGSTVLESYTENKKNWFLYQFFDEHRRCPVVEWRINKRVIREFGPLLRGTLFVSFHAGESPKENAVELILRPQIRYNPESDLDFIVPTDLLPDKQVVLDVHPITAEGIA